MSKTVSSWLIYIENSKTREEISIEAAHEPAYLYLRYLQIQLSF